MSLLEKVMHADREFLDAFGIDVVEVAPGHVALRGRPSPALVNSAGVVHGSYAFALLDTAAAYALAARDVHAVTIGTHVVFSRPVAPEASIMATADVVTAGRTLATVRAALSADDRVAALATLQFKVVTDRLG
ncbi:MAG: PaaI family thioesterase [Acidimicrobiia bacterium]|nr:PaaI family thioesterase [Acidimicrobiia bacterium]MDH4306876.1 PaaI family thioesterase [Acidimicrobiia bacterium]